MSSEGCEAVGHRYVAVAKASALVELPNVDNIDGMYLPSIRRTDDPIFGENHTI